MLTNKRNYLDSLNFATNLVLFRDGQGPHTRLATANYWSAYGAKAPTAWCCLMDEDGGTLAEWTDPLPGATASRSEAHDVGNECVTAFGSAGSHAHQNKKKQ